MTTIKRLLFTAVVTAAAASGAVGQDTGSNTSSVGGSSSSPSGGTSRIFDSSSFQAPTITGLSSTNATTQGSLSRSNGLGAYYANPFFAGQPGATTLTAPGGFGQTLYQRTNTSSSSVSSARGGSNAFSSAAGASPFSSQTGFGGNTGTGGGFGGNRGLGNTGTGGQNRAGQQGFGQTGTGFGGAQASGVVIPAPGPIAYTATLRFAVARPTATQVATDLRGMLDRSAMLTNSKTIDLFTDGSKVVLRGTVASAEERETAEGMIRLTPGVFEVSNELQVVAPATPAAPPTPPTPMP